MIQHPTFEDVAPQCNADIETSFRHKGKIYTIATSYVVPVNHIQFVVDAQEGYIGPLGNYETMLFIDGDSIIYPFGDLPGHPGLGVFQRYDAEEEARDGHHDFVTRVKRILQDVGEQS